VLRDHAGACPLDSEQPGRWTWHAGGAHARLGRAGLCLVRPGDDGPAAERPASGGPRAGTRDPGSNAGSSNAAGTCTRTLCAGTFAGVVGALWPENGAFPYTDVRPKEVHSPEGKPGENALTFSPGANKTRTRRLLVSLRFSKRTRQRIRLLWICASERDRRIETPLGWRSPDDQEWRCSPARSQFTENPVH
jgi:hypothetical protein